MPAAVPVLSVVVPMYDEEDVLPIFFERMHPLLDSLGISYEVVAVDDGSRDATATLLTETVKTWPQLRLVRLLRNSGHQAALSAGFRRARGEYLVSIDADLQDPPEVIAELLAAARDQDVDVVYGVRSDRSSDTWAKRTTARMYYRLMCRLVGREIPFDAGDFRLVSRRVVDAVNALPEDGRVFRLVIPWLGFPSTAIRYVRAERAAGVTKYTLRKRLGLAFDSVTAFSAAPLRLATWLGLLGGLVSCAVVVGALVIKLAGRSIPGWTSTVLAVAVIGAIQLLCLGLLGEYVARLFQSSQKRPQFLVGYDSLEDPGHHTYAEALESSDPEQR
ncbi:glycosyltransferase family 2 protein [Kribbella italica]|uniref:Dolichol-phosphate mannosyltransferase n=1 Tax=Kribbella italica TaxID=1540520 RepID=A0A7W9JD55_9ACTN|nr:glycosyltransferase family 2 protein [Kribbella italica]MBB5839799.1 dolichol-phosphate mannosyltransferase [Kribbella italica]